MSRCGQDRQPLEAQRRLFRSADGRQWLVLEAAVGIEARSARLAAVLELDERALFELVHLQLEAEEALDNLEREFRRGEEHAVIACTEPDRATNAAGNGDRVLAPFVDPGGRHRATERLQ